MAGECLPNAVLPLVKELLCHIVERVAFSELEYTCSAELPQRLVNENADFVVVLVAGVAQSKNNKVQVVLEASRLFLLQLLNPIVEFCCVVARFAFVVRGCANDDQCVWDLAEFRLFEICEINNPYTIEAIDQQRFSLQNLTELFSGSRLASIV